MSRSTTDAATARLIRNLRRALHAERVRNFPPRTIQPGPRAMTRMTGGALAMEGCRALMEDNPQGHEWAVADFARRGMAESAAALGDDAATNDEFVDEDGYDLRLGAVDGEMSRYGVERVGKEITAQAGEDDGRDVTALSPAEVIEDLEAQDADPQAIDTYALAVGDSDISPSDDLIDQLQTESSAGADHDADMQFEQEAADEQVAEM